MSKGKTSSRSHEYSLRCTIHKQAGPTPTLHVPFRDGIGDRRPDSNPLISGQYDEPGLAPMALVYTCLGIVSCSRARADGDHAHPHIVVGQGGNIAMAVCVRRSVLFVVSMFEIVPDVCVLMSERSQYAFILQSMLAFNVCDLFVSSAHLDLRVQS